MTGQINLKGAMLPQRYDPMTLGNMRRNGVRSLASHCSARNCHQQAVLEVDSYPDHVPVLSFGPRMPFADTKGLTRA